jgi:hypothetical protein
MNNRHLAASDAVARRAQQRWVLRIARITQRELCSVSFLMYFQERGDRGGSEGRRP